MTQYIAHVSEDKSRFHLLEDHLTGVAAMAAEFGASEWAYIAGLWHDLGKYSPEFQSMIRSAVGSDASTEMRPGRVDHSTAGGIHAVDRFGWLGRVFAYIIAGHHAGLPDWLSESSGGGGLAHRLGRRRLIEAAKTAGIPHEIVDRVLPTEKPRKSATDLSRSMWVRMLYSCVVDADFLDTERFFDPEKAATREGHHNLPDLQASFGEYMQGKSSAAPDTPVNRVRRKVLDHCIEVATEPPGVFSLTVPTGGGKTLSSMAFALHHAVSHGKKRVLYVIPYTSIIEQAADQFRKVFGEAAPRAGAWIET